MARTALALLLVACGARDSLEDLQADGGASGSAESTAGGPSDAGSGAGGFGGEPGQGGAGPGMGGFGGTGSDPTSVVQLSAGSAHTCARLSNGKVRCWGTPTFLPGAAGSALGYANTDTIGDDETPASAGDVEVGGDVIQITAGTEHTCALLANGGVRCWGAGDFGRLGYGNTVSLGDDETPASVGDVEVGGDVVQIAAGHVHTCALLANGAVRCWGYGGSGALGYGNAFSIGDDETPASAGDVDVGGEAIQITAGTYHTCALLAAGGVRCWGNAAHGQLGYGNTVSIGDDETPASAGDVDVGDDVAEISSHADHTCALLSTGAVRCWGRGLEGALGYGNTDRVGDDETPASAGDVAVGAEATQIHARLHTCAVLANAAVRCWGPSYYGALGYANTSWIGDDEIPASAGSVDVGGPVVQLTLGDLHTCALLESGEVRCWGAFAKGQLGYAKDENIGDDETPASAGDVQIL